jgi:UDP-2,3-diacylglucosamine hydrolase
MAAEIMDVNAQAVEASFKAHHATQMIHGHTHRPARHDLLIDGTACTRWVLADWHGKASWLEADAHGLSAKTL